MSEYKGTRIGGVTAGTVTQPPAQPAQEQPRAERVLRRLLAYRCAGAALYADDGELQDNSAEPCIDFKRDSVDTIEEKLGKRARSALAAKTAQPSTGSAIAFPPSAAAREASRDLAGRLSAIFFPPSTGEVDVGAERKLFEAEFPNVDWQEGATEPRDEAGKNRWHGWLAARRTQAEGAREVEEARREGWGEGMQEAQWLLSQEIEDATRYDYLLTCDYLAAKKYLPDLDEAEHKAKLRAKHDAAIAATQSADHA